jgi:signal transduction histidine kinase
MQQNEQTAATKGTERKRVETVVETLARLGGSGNTLAEVAHDTRNMVTALGLYCELLEEPGVLNPPYQHYGQELRLVAAASRRLVEKLVALDAGSSSARSLPAIENKPATEWPMEFGGGIQPAARPIAPSATESARWADSETELINNLAAELMANRNLLSALAGPAVAVTIDAQGGALPVAISCEDLTRIMVNLVKNASEAMPAGGRIQVAVREMTAEAGSVRSLQLSIEDNGPGIPAEAIDKVFASGFTTRAGANLPNNWPATHRGLGLSITRSIVEAAGGRIEAARDRERGARFEIELPVRQTRA